MTNTTFLLNQYKTNIAAQKKDTILIQYTRIVHNNKYHIQSIHPESLQPRWAWRSRTQTVPFKSLSQRHWVDWYGARHLLIWILNWLQILHVHTPCSRWLRISSSHHRIHCQDDPSSLLHQLQIPLFPWAGRSGIENTEDIKQHSLSTWHSFWFISWKLSHQCSVKSVRMADWSKALRSGCSLLWRRGFESHFWQVSFARWIHFWTFFFQAPVSKTMSTVSVNYR